MQTGTGVDRLHHRLFNYDLGAFKRVSLVSKVWPGCIRHHLLEKLSTDHLKFADLDIVKLTAPRE